MTRAVLFDLYDTLAVFDWERQLTLVAEHLDLEPAAVGEAYDRLRQHRDSGGDADARGVLISVARACGVAPSPDVLDRLAAAEADLLAERVTLYPDALPAMRGLRAEGVATAIVSNCSPSTRPVVDRLQLEDEVDAVLLSCELGVAKPDRAIFTRALERLRISAQDTMFVDDRVDYLDGAAAVGLGTWRIVRGDSFGELPEDGDHPVVADLAELLERLNWTTDH